MWFLIYKLFIKENKKMSFIDDIAYEKCWNIIGVDCWDDCVMLKKYIYSRINGY